jgi:antitoxin (DNA-binding transcriptional repressor) of toxin-antitoxin stability system
METLSVREYRNNLSASFDKVDKGEQVIVRRKNKMYALISIGEEDVTISPKKKRQIESMTRKLRKSLEEVKLVEAGKLEPKKWEDFINEL